VLRQAIAHRVRQTADRLVGHDTFLNSEIPSQTAPPAIKPMSKLND
jgi:hypothetical protein